MPARPIYYDTETTGIRSKEDRIVEIAAFDPERGATLEKLINPGVPIPAEASAVHKITDEMVADAPAFGVVAAEFVEFCEGDVVLIAHNNDGFDKHFLRAEFERHGVEKPEWKMIDSLKWSRRYRSDLPRHALQFLREVYGVESNDAHRALDDVVVLHAVFSQMIDDLSMDVVYELLNRPQQVDRMPFGKHQGKLLADLPADYLSWLKGSGALDKDENRDLRTSLEKAGV